MTTGSSGKGVAATAGAQPSRREQSAAQTRSRLLSSARELLLTGGPSAMTIAALADDAGVSPQTVYNSVGGKAQVVKAVYDVMLAGDEDPVPMSERPAFRAVTDAADVSSWAAAYARWTEEIYARVGSLLGALLADGPAGDPALTAFLADIDRERRVGNRNGLAGLRSRGLLPTGTSLDRLIDGVWVLTAPEVHDRLVRQRGWSGDAYADWLAAHLRTVIENAR